MMPEKKRKTGPPSVLALFCCLLWGSAFPCIKIGYRLFHIVSGDTADILLFAGTRFFFGGVLVLLAGSIIHRRPLLPQKKDWPGIFIVGMCQTFLQYSFFYLGLAYTTASRSSILNGCTAFFSLLIAALIFRQEKLTWRKVLGCLIGFAGILVMNLSSMGMPGGQYLLGDVLILGSGIVTSAANSLIRRYSARTDPTLLNGWQFTWGGAALAMVGLAFGGRLSFTASGCYWVLLWLSFLSAMAYTLWSILLSYHPVSRISIFMCATPLFGVAFTALLLGETQEALRLQNLAALVLVCAGVLVLHTEKKRQTDPS